MCSVNSSNWRNHLWNMVAICLAWIRLGFWMVEYKRYLVTLSIIKGYWIFWIKFHSIYLIHTLRRTQKEKVIKMKDAYIPISFNKLWIAGRGLFKCEFLSSSSLFFLYYDDFSLGLIIDAKQIGNTKQKLGVNIWAYSKPL